MHGSPVRSRVTAVLGPTNTGKTYLAVERMLGHRSGMIGFPLRLLARENYDRIVALKERVRVLSLGILNGEKRLPGLVKKICGVDSLAWCQDADKLERLLAAIGKIKEEAYGET